MSKNKMTNIKVVEEFKQSIPYKDNQNKARFCLKFIKSNPDNEVIQEVKSIIHSDDLVLVRKYLTDEIKTCPICGKLFYKKHSQACSKECRKELIKRSLRETNLKKYGVEWFTSTKDFKTKVETTLIKRYGVSNSAQIPSAKEKCKETCLKTYGTQYYFQTDDFKNKVNQTSLERYGVEHHTQSSSSKANRRETNLKKYGVEYVTQSKMFREKSKQTCLEKYGVDNFSKSHLFHDKINEHITEALLNDLKQLKIKHLDDINETFLNTLIINIDKRTFFDLEKCEKYFEISYPIVKRIKNAFNIKYPNFYEREIKSRSNAEIELFNWIPCDNKVSNDRKIIYPLELDMVLPDYKLAIEYDGVYWHSDEYKDKSYHLNKTIECQKHGYQLFHIFDTDDIDIWKSMINNKLKLNTKVYARQCHVKEISNTDAKSFCTQNHLQGSCPSKFNLGLFYNDELLEVMTFGKPRYTKTYQYELLRLCTKKYYSVIGGASKLFNYFKQTYNPNSIISYANRRFSNGSIYETLGFKFKHASEPNYWYVKYNELLSRVKCQKHKLKKMFDMHQLEVYNENMSESEIMQSNGYFKIFDCGNLVYSYISN